MPSSFPVDPKTLARAFDDRRIDDLREMVQQAVRGKVEFNCEFAIRTLQEVLRVEGVAAVRRKFTGWSTLPLGLIPVIGTGVQKVAEETINTLWSDRPQKEFAWYYLISDLVATQRNT